jgi:hypothetical protein
MLWTDNMMIPRHAEHPADAIAYMDFVYRPEVAAMIADWVGYITPVPSAQPLIAHRYHDEAVAQSPLVFPNTAPDAREVTSRFLVYPVFSSDYDERAGELAELAAGQNGKPWLVWCSPTVEQGAEANQVGLSAYLEQLDASNKTYLNASINPAKLKEEVLALLKPDSRALPETQGKPRVYLVYNARDRNEVKNAGLISFHFRKEIHFEHPDDPAQHTLRLSRSDGVLLVWGAAGEDWCSREFAEIVQASGEAAEKGMCLFDPPETKTDAVKTIRDAFRELYVGEQFGRFDPARLETFFAPLLRRSGGPP